MDKCILCGGILGQDSRLLDCPNMPASAQDIPAYHELSGDRGKNLQLCQCPCCGLVQFTGEPVAYYRDVIRSGGYSSTMTELRREQYRHFIGICGLEGKKIVEIGCGQGEFLKVLAEFPVQAFGIEHNPQLAESARNAGLNVRQAFADTADTLLEHAPFDAFLSFNFLEHQPDPNGMLRCIHRNLAEEAYGLVTVPSWEYMLENDGYYELLRDHIAYYSEETLRFLFNRNGFTVLESSIVNRDTLSMVVQKRRNADVSGLARGYERMTAMMQGFVKQRMTQGKTVAVWGASHQGFTVVSTTGVGDGIRYIIDSAPFKQGRYAPASHVPIVPPEHFFADPVNCILIIAPGYTDEIAEIIRTRFGPDVEISAIRTDTVESLDQGENSHE